MCYRSLVVALSVIVMGSAASAWEADLGDGVHVLRWTGPVTSLVVRADNVGGDRNADTTTEGTGEVMVQLFCSAGGSDWIFGMFEVEVAGAGTLNPSAFNFDEVREERRIFSIYVSNGKGEGAVAPVEQFSQDDFSAVFSDDVSEWSRSSESEVIFEYQGSEQFFGVPALFRQIRTAGESITFTISSEPVVENDSDHNRESISISFTVPAAGSTAAAKQVLDRCYGG